MYRDCVNTRYYVTCLIRLLYNPDLSRSDYTGSTVFFQIYVVILSNCVYPDIPHPAVEFLKMEQMFDEQGKVCYDVLKEHLKQEGRVEEDVALR